MDLEQTSLDWERSQIELGKVLRQVWERFKEGKDDMENKRQCYLLLVICY